MLKRLLIVAVCCAFGLFLATVSFSQNLPKSDEPGTTEFDKDAAENKPDDAKKEVKDDIKKSDTIVKKDEGAKTDDKAAVQIIAKTFSDGLTNFVNSKVLFKLTSQDDIALDKIEYKIDDGAIALFDKPFAIEKEGPHTIKYYGIDKAGNKESEKAYQVIVDNTGPVIVVSSNMPVMKIGDKIYYSKDIQFSISATDALSGVEKVEYSLDGTAFQDYTTPFKITQKNEINLKVKAIDNVNNITEQFAFRIFDETGKEVDMKEATVKLLTDSIPPIVEIKPDKEVKQYNYQNVATSDVKYAITAKDDDSGVATILFRLNGKGDFVPYNKDKDVIQFLTSGKHMIEAKAVDKVGNVSNVLNYSVYVDMLPPDSKIEAIK